MEVVKAGDDRNTAGPGGGNEVGKPGEMSDLNVDQTGTREQGGEDFLPGFIR
jgi:hypothetical protein